MNYTVRFADQLKQHLRALRKDRGLTQARLAQLLGVHQTRIAAIEKNPGVLSVDQLFRLLSALGVHLVLQDNQAPFVAEGIPQASTNPDTPSPPGEESW